MKDYYKIVIKHDKETKKPDIVYNGIDTYSWPTETAVNEYLDETFGTEDGIYLWMVFPPKRKGNIQTQTQIKRAITDDMLEIHITRIIEEEEKKVKVVKINNKKEDVEDEE